MNFLLHRHLAARALNSGAAGHAAMLPDLWRMADRRVRATAEAPAPAEGSPPLDHEVEAGIAHHLEADRWFHRSIFFTEGEAAVGARFRAAAFVAPRMPLLAHAAWELCLDGALVRRQGLAPTLSLVAAGRDLLGEGAIERAAARHHFDRVPRTDPERAAFGGRMTDIVERLVDGRWVSAYTTADGVAAVLDAMRRRLSLSGLGERDRRALGEALAPMVERADAALDALLAAAP